MTRPHPLLLLALATLVSGLPARAAAAPKPASAMPEATADELRSMLAAGKCDELLAKTATLTTRYPADPDVLVFDANCRLSKARTVQQRFDATAYERLRAGAGGLSLTRGNETAFYRPETTYDQAGLAKALETFRKALSLAPERADLVVGNVAVLATTGRLDDAVTLLRERKQAIGADGPSDLAHVVGDLLAEHREADAARLAAALAELFPASNDVRRAQGLVALAQHQTIRAVDAFLPLARVTPPDAALSREVARLLMFSRRWTEAVEVLAPIAPESVETTFQLGLARMRTSPASALPIFNDAGERAAKQKPRNEALMKLIAHYTKLVSDPRQPTPVMHLHAADQFARGVMPLAAVIELDAALQQEPGLVEAWRKLSDVYRMNGMYDLALAALDSGLQAATSAPEGTTAYSPAELQADRGRVLFALDRDDDSATAFAAARAGGHPAPYEEGVVALARNHKDQAIAFLEEASKDPGDLGTLAKAKLQQVNPPPAK